MEKYTLIDFDGVILDTEEKIIERMNDLHFNTTRESGYIEYFKYASLHNEEWEYILSESKQINNSIDIIRELESLKKKIAIISKIHTIQEMNAKVNELRKRNIYSPVILCPPDLNKHEVVEPKHQLLIDDSTNNINSWIRNGGVGLLFNPNLKEDTKDKVRSLEFLLRK